MYSCSCSCSPRSCYCESCPEVEAYIGKEEKPEIHFTAMEYDTIEMFRLRDEDDTLDAEEWFACQRSVFIIYGVSR